MDDEYCKKQEMNVKEGLEIHYKKNNIKIANICMMNFARINLHKE